MFRHLFLKLFVLFDHDFLTEYIAFESFHISEFIVKFLSFMEDSSVPQYIILMDDHRFMRLISL